jgi:hypothetical protein
MTHAEIMERGWAEAYVKRGLSPEERSVFEEHYFRCDQCFDEVQELERFVAGVRHASRRGLLDPPEPRKWLIPAFAFSAAATLVLTAIVVTLAFVRMPQMETKLAHAVEDASMSQTEVAKLQRQAALEIGAQANVPVVILEASRSADAINRLESHSASATALLWIDVPPQPAGTQFGITITSRDGTVTKSIHGLERNQNGALSAGVALRELPQGPYVVRLFKESAPSQTIEEYRLTVTIH